MLGRIGAAKYAVRYIVQLQTYFFSPLMQLLRWIMEVRLNLLFDDEEQFVQYRQKASVKFRCDT